MYQLFLQKRLQILRLVDGVLEFMIIQSSQKSRSSLPVAYFILKDPFTSQICILQWKYNQTQLDSIGSVISKLAPIPVFISYFSDKTRMRFTFSRAFSDHEVNNAVNMTVCSSYIQLVVGSGNQIVASAISESASWPVNHRRIERFFFSSIAYQQSGFGRSSNTIEPWSKGFRCRFLFHIHRGDFSGRSFFFRSPLVLPRQSIRFVFKFTTSPCSFSTRIVIWAGAGGLCDVGWGICEARDGKW